MHRLLLAITTVALAACETPAHVTCRSADGTVYFDRDVLDVDRVVKDPVYRVDVTLDERVELPATQCVVVTQRRK